MYESNDFVILNHKLLYKVLDFIYASLSFVQ